MSLVGSGLLLGRPSIGPVSPATTPSSAALSTCWVWFALAIGAGLSTLTACRRSRSKAGLGGAPVAILSPRALPTNGLSPLFATSTPPILKMPHFRRSRREICPCDQALRISWRFLRAFSAALSLLGRDFLWSHMQQPSSAGTG